MLVPALLVAAFITADPATVPAALRKPSLGISVISMDEARDIAKAEKTRAPAGEGVMVKHIMPHTPAQEAGLKPRDVIRTIGGKPAADYLSDLATNNTVKPGDSVELKYLPASETKSGKTTRVIWAKETSIDLTYEAAGAIAVKCMKRTEDPVEQTVFLRHEWAPDSIPRTNDQQLYFQVKPDDTAFNLRIKVGYIGTTWLFVRGLSLRTGDKLHKVNIGPFKADTEILRSGGVAEWIDISVGDAGPALRTVSVNGDPVFLRLTGKSFNEDRELDDITRMLWATTMDAYQWLGGSLEQKKPD